MGRRSIAHIRREEFARAAFEVLAIHGMQGTTLQRVADHTGASKASVLHYFSNKQSLIETALRQSNATLRKEAVALMNLATTPWERFYAIIEANFSPTTFQPEIAHGWIAMCAEVPHVAQFQRIQAVIYSRLHCNLLTALLATGIDRVAADSGAETISLLIDGLWLRCGLRIGGLNRQEATAQIERVVESLFGDSAERKAAKTKMAELAAALTSRTQ
ncbi:transcriptional regulator [Octadecabacter arcticus 238]|jgi:TetR/AcrR family transcriptional repressor of bet genes|uniref:Transcriptional regulator n=1 Tax=Octadecabacter arcticus 238 TaxID=391616 RepID=M9RS47_9RHOB|nr:transcriptional regulator BetI [Octadecabacter arcticus]AGI72645.1 transcriptional regulator [Octadecabacter arcticus 238]